MIVATYLAQVLLTIVRTSTTPSISRAVPAVPSATEEILEGDHDEES